MITKFITKMINGGNKNYYKMMTSKYDTKVITRKIIALTKYKIYNRNI
jgi:hypothetical protein